MKVKALKPHMNGYGDKYVKAKDDTYDVPDHAAGPLINKGMVEEVKPSDDGLRDLTVADLDKIIASEGVEVAGNANKAAKIDAIIANRVTPSGDAD